MVLTHAHIDHSRYLPVLVRTGFAGQELATEATADLCGILLPAAGFLQEKEPEFANRHGFSKHRPALPLYTRRDAEPMPKVLISASGMATGGRVLHHLKHYAPDPRSTILFAGFQAGGTRGAAMIDGAEQVKIHGDYVPVRAEVDNLDMLSAHADAGEILTWLRHFERPPKMTFITHGEPAASDALRHRIEEELGWPCTAPAYRDAAELE